MITLQELHQEINSCFACDLCKHQNHVPGEGPENAEIMFVGEGPGFHEDQQKRPFVGAAGRFLEELLASVGLKREQVYITNVVKGRPPNNRDPLPSEIEACHKHLERQLSLIKPKLIVTLGRFSLAWFLPKETIGRVHGEVRVNNGQHILPLYHPAAALHAQSMRKVIEDDFRKLPAALEQAKQAPPAATAEPEPEQLSLF